MWTCIVCGTTHDAMPPLVERERSLCSACGATWRNRATLMTLMIGLSYRPVPLPDLPSDWSRRGIGLSDSPPLVPAFASKLSYTNTYYHQFPHVDITRPPANLVGQLEFIICSDVLEHVPPPVERGLVGLLECLRPGGFAVITVPVAGERTNEYYPGLTDFEVAGDPQNGHVVNWTDATGARHTDTTPDMHGGSGLTLAFRLFAAQDIRAELLRAGFVTVSEPPPMPDLGISQLADPGIFLARKGPLTGATEGAGTHE
jgi:SAM-dependent methyltransferase